MRNVSQTAIHGARDSTTLTTGWRWKTGLLCLLLAVTLTVSRAHGEQPSSNTAAEPGRQPVIITFDAPGAVWGTNPSGINPAGWSRDITPM